MRIGPQSMSARRGPPGPGPLPAVGLTNPALGRTPRAPGYTPAVPPTPRIVVLGGPVPERLRSELEGNVELLGPDEVGDAPLSAVLVHAHPDARGAVRAFRESGGTTPVFGFGPIVPGIAERLEWIREGAEDLLHPDSAAGALLQRLRGDAPRREVDADEAPVDARLDRYLVALDQYLASRRDLTRRLGDVGAMRYLQTVVARQHVVRAADHLGSPLPAGERRGSTREPMGWPLRLVDAPGAWAELRDVSADGLGIALDPEPRGRGPLRLEIEGLTVSAEIELEIRWRRRQPDHWEAGGWAVRATITRSA